MENIVKPEPRIRCLEQNDKYGKFVVEPLEKGYGHTLGNSLRRVLMSSIPGSAITAIKVDGVLHEFSAIPGVKEDTTELILNLKELDIQLSDPEADPNEVRMGRISVRGEGEVTGADIQLPPELTMISPERHIATLTSSKAKLEVELTIERGTGYVPSDENRDKEREIGVIPIDAVFAPVRKVAYNVEPTRLGHQTDLDRLTMEVWTNGAIRPGQAVSDAAKIISDYLRLFFDFQQRAEEEKKLEAAHSREKDRVLEFRTDDLDFSVRTYNCLKKANVNVLGDLIIMSEADLMGIRNFGRKSLNEVKDKLQEYNLALQESKPGEELDELGEDEDFDVDLDLEDDSIV